MHKKIKKIIRHAVIVLACLILYIASIPGALIVAYEVKAALNINAMENGGWHHFNSCLSQEMDLERQDLQEGRYGVLAPLAPLLISWGLLPEPDRAGSR